jgi:hypothetical protein
MCVSRRHKQLEGLASSKSHNDIMPFLHELHTRLRERCGKSMLVTLLLWSFKHALWIFQVSCLSGGGISLQAPGSRIPE